jgi:hypothetical protein
VEYDKDKVDECTLALLSLVVCERTKPHGGRAWKSFDWDTLDRLYQKGYIADPKNKAKSVELSEDGILKAEELFQKFFGEGGS